MDQIRKLVERNSTLALVVSLYGISALAKSMELGNTERFVMQGAVFVFFLYLQMVSILRFPSPPHRPAAPIPTAHSPSPTAIDFTDTCHLARTSLLE